MCQILFPPSHFPPFPQRASCVGLSAHCLLLSSLVHRPGSWKTKIIRRSHGNRGSPFSIVTETSNTSQERYGVSWGISTFLCHTTYGFPLSFLTKSCPSCHITIFVKRIMPYKTVCRYTHCFFTCSAAQTSKSASSSSKSSSHTKTSKTTPTTAGSGGGGGDSAHPQPTRSSQRNVKRPKTYDEELAELELAAASKTAKRSKGGVSLGRGGE